jgi:glycosyltransferase involved in cell wall biosynthesis
MITVVKPLLGLHRREEIFARVVLEQQAARRDIDWADAIVFCRNAEPRYAPLLAAARSRGVPLMYDLDDNLLELPRDCDGPSRLRESSRQAMLEEYLRAAALVRVYSRPVAERVERLNPRIVQCFAPVDLSLVRSAAPKINPQNRPIKIVYATSRTQDALCEIFLPALEQILRRRGDQVEAHFWGCRPPRIESLPNLRHHGLVCSYERYLRRFSRAGYDIGLAPLPDNVFFRSKTNNKFREYGASGVAGIYSNNEVYASCVQHEATGLLVANDTESWHAAIERLIDDSILRAGIQRQARQFVTENYAQEKFENLFRSQLEEIMTGRRQASYTSSVESDWQPRESRLPGFFQRLASQTLHSLNTLRRLNPSQAWSALRWYFHDRCLATWLRWRL